jgi:hypothetical protein
MADGSSPTQRAGEVTCPTSPVRELLLAYHGVLGVVDALPAVPFVLWTHADRGLPARLRYLPRPKWLLRLFVVRHFDASLALLARRYSAGAALGSLSEADLRDREAMKEFRQSLPPVRQVLCLVLLVVAVLAVARPLPVLLAKYLRRVPLPGRSESLQATIEQLGQGFSTNAGSVDKALNSLVKGGPGQTAELIFILALAAYLVLRPFVPAFRLKRMLLNLSADRREPWPSATSRWSVSQSTGIYEQERQVFAELGVRRAREVPFDLLVPALAMLVPLAFAVSGVTEVITGSSSAGDRWLSAMMATLFLIISVVRLGWLYRMWRRRLGRFGPCMPFEVGIPADGRLSVAKVERPVGVRILVFGLFLWLLLVFGSAGADPNETLPQLQAFMLAAALLFTAPVSYLWWRRVNHELRGLDEPVRPRSTDRRSGTRIGTIVGTLTVVPAFNALSRRIRRAQTRAGLPQTLRFGWLLLPALLVHPLLVAYLQYELNKIWTVLGEPLDPWNGSPPAPEADLPQRLPWLRAPSSPRAPHLPEESSRPVDERVQIGWTGFEPRVMP